MRAISPQGVTLLSIKVRYGHTGITFSSGVGLILESLQAVRLSEAVMCISLRSMSLATFALLLLVLLPYVPYVPTQRTHSTKM